jgi:hypothetical protein
VRFSSSLCDLHAVSHQLLIAWTTLYETWYVCHGIWAHPNGALRKSFPSSVCLYPCVSFLGNGSVNTFPRQVIPAAIEELLDASFFLCGPCLIRGKSTVACIPLSLLGNDSVKTLPLQRRNCWRCRFLCGPCLIRGNSMVLCIPLSLLGKDSVKTFPLQRRNCWRCRFLWGPCLIRGKSGCVSPYRY